MKRFIHTSLGSVAVRIRPAHSSARITPGTPPWVLLHGASGSWRTFRELVRSPVLPDTCDHVMIDLPGWGESPGMLPFTVEQQGRAVAEVLRGLNYRSWYLFGHSMGAVLALDIAASHPEETHAVVALSPTALTAGAALNHPLRHPSMAPLLGMFGLMFILRILGRAAPWLLRRAERAGLLRLVLGPFFAAPSDLQRPVFADLALDARPASFIAAAHALKKYDAGTWHSITAPVVLARGSKDIFTPPGELRSLAALMPHSQSVVLNRTGHFAQIENPAETAGLMTALRAASKTLDAPD